MDEAPLTQQTQLANPTQVGEVLPIPSLAKDSVFARALDRALAVQRPVVLAHIRSVRLRHPEASPEQVIHILERRYLAAVTGGGATVGATAVIPAIGTAATLTLSGVETLGFLESTALFAQSVAEVHGIPVENPERARVLVMTLLLGEEGTNLLNQMVQQVTGAGANRASFWGEIVTKTMPNNALGPVFDRIRRAFTRKLAKTGSASVVGKAIPFGIGAVVGGAGNRILGRKVIVASRHAFGAPPQYFRPELSPRQGAERIERRLARGARVAGGSVAMGAGAVGRGVKRAATSLTSRARRRRPTEEQ